MPASWRWSNVFCPVSGSDWRVRRMNSKDQFKKLFYNSKRYTVC
jgi:hypothetical protein